MFVRNTKFTRQNATAFDKIYRFSCSESRYNTIHGAKSMVVYWEYAFLENTFIDALLLYLALKCSRQKTSWWRLILAALIGGAEAVVFPLIAFPSWTAHCVKILGGILIAVLAVRRGSFKIYAITAGAFFAFTFALGGLLTACYSFFGIEYLEGQGYFIESVPVGLLFSVAGAFTIVCVNLIRFAYRFRKTQQNIAECTLNHNHKTVAWRGLVDSGNLLFFHGRPVNVISSVAVFALFGRQAKDVGRMTVHTANGERDCPVFECESMSVKIGRSVRTANKVLFTIGDVNTKTYQIILHTAFTEECHENFERVENVAAKDKGK